MKNEVHEIRRPYRSQRPQTKKLIDFGCGKTHADDAANLLGIGMSDFVRLAITTCIAVLPAQLGASLSAARASDLFQTKISTLTKRKFCTLDFGSAKVQAKVDQLRVNVAEWSSPPEGKNTIQIGCSHRFESGPTLHFFEEDAFDEKWYRILGCETLTDPTLRSAVGLLIFIRLYHFAMGDSQFLDKSLRDEAKMEIQRVLRRHTKRTFYSLKRRYQRIPQLRTDAEGCGKIPPFIRTKYWNDPFVLEFYVRWRRYPNNFSKEFTESDVRYDEEILRDLSDEEK